MTVVKKTVAIHPIMNSYVRKTWALLIEKGHNATYSTALNFVLLAAIFEVGERGLSENTTKRLNNFLEDASSINELNLEDYLMAIKEAK